MKAIFSGHTHSDEFRVLRTASDGLNDPVPLVPVYIMPSLPPYNPSTNPAVRLFDFDTGTASVITDYHQHTLLLDASNAVKADTWDVYSPRSLYGMPDLSMASWESLAVRMDKDDDLFQLYYQAFTGFPAVAIPCSDDWEPSVYSPHGGGGKCKTALLCPVLSARSDDDYHACIMQRNSSSGWRHKSVSGQIARMHYSLPFLQHHFQGLKPFVYN